MARIIEYTGEKEAVISLLQELQEHLVSIDDERVQIMTTQYGKNYFSYLQKLMSQNNGIMYLALKDKTIVGLIAGYIEPKDEEDRISNRCPKRGIVSDLVVSPHFRSKGVGGELMRTLEQYFSDTDCEFVAVNVFAPNRAAQRFYSSIGYA